MKIISLNTFAGRIFKPLMDFVERMAPETDVLCFQEVVSDPGGVITPPDKHGLRANLLQELEARLPDFAVVFTYFQDDFDVTPSPNGRTQYGLATFVRRTLPITASHDFYLGNGYNTYLPGDYSTLGCKALLVTVHVKGLPLTVVNLHGLSEPGSKRDTPERLEQSRRILDATRGHSGETILMGDWNLFPDTESIRMIEVAGFRNLIKDYAVTTTRGTLCKQLNPQYANTSDGHQEFADYTFVTNGLTVRSFAVPDLPVSDHLPMILDVC